jgi:hypothetical protein
MHKVVTPSALIIIDADVMKTYLHADTEFGNQEADSNVESVWQFIKDKSIYHVIIPDPTTHITVDVKNYKNEMFVSVKRAEALVIRSLAHRILAKAFMSAGNRPYPIRIFDCESDALAWFDKLRSAS